MQQLSLFPQPVNKEPPIDYYPNFLNKEEADEIFNYCVGAIAWKQNQIRMIGKQIDLPRLEAMYGDKGCDYIYSGSVHLSPLPWTSELLALKQKVEDYSKHLFNIVIGNYYRSGADYIGWHSDNEPSMGVNPAIASISLGIERKFQMREKPKGEIHSFWLKHGSLLLMRPGCQSKWAHQLPKSASACGQRINLTFRPHIGTASTAIIA
jgi:alkylated DNA repair dioxygenase AlkB